MNFNFKCIKGIFRDNSFRLYHTSDGHIIGCGSDDINEPQHPTPDQEEKKVNQSCENTLNGLTMFSIGTELNGSDFMEGSFLEPACNLKVNFKVKDVGFCPRHAHIRWYKEFTSYTIRDLSFFFAENESHTPGTWLTVPTNNLSDADWYNLQENEGWKREFVMSVTLNDQTVLITFREIDEPIDALERWLYEQGQAQLYTPLHQLNVKTLLDLRDFNVESLQSLGQIVPVAV